jgi:hypothetical protein
LMYVPLVAPPTLFGTSHALLEPMKRLLQCMMILEERLHCLSMGEALTSKAFMVFDGLNFDRDLTIEDFHALLPRGKGRSTLFTLTDRG